MNDSVCVSVVSHGHGELVANLLNDLALYCWQDVRVLLTVNIPEPIDIIGDIKRLPFPVDLIANSKPRGFGANHNAAFRRSKGGLFCIMNPDIRLPANPFPALSEALKDDSVGVVAPRVLDESGSDADSARRFPTLLSLLGKAFSKNKVQVEYPGMQADYSPDWVAGMFMMFRRDVYAALGGFDERYYLYYEDVDLCRRLRAKGFVVRVVTEAKAIHHARRTSHRHPRFMFWHLKSMARYLLAVRRVAR